MGDLAVAMQRLRERIEARRKRREGFADLQAELRDLMTKQLNREIKAERRKAA
jgi:antitoxin component of MazEF toxin-antitoxin module